MGTVFLAEHALIKRRVAMKILHPELATDAHVIERFMNEARAAGTLGHPNIVESTDMGFTHNHVPYIVFEYLEGTLLTDEIYRVGGLPVRRAVRIAQQIASALQMAHNANIVHRDLKSDNIFLTDKDDALDHVKVLDFGISRFLEVDDEQTRRGMVMGTPEFMAPEQITAPDSVDRRADIYALGVILYEMVTARRPFSNDEDPRALLHRIVHNEPPPLQRPEVPHAMCEMIMHRLLAKDPNARFQSMLDVEAALDAFTTHGDGPRIRRSRPLPVQAADDVARHSDTIPRPMASVDTPYPGVHLSELQQMAASQVSLPKPPAHKKPWVMYGLAGAGLLIGVIGLAIGLRGGSEKVAIAPTPAPTSVPLPAAAPPAPREVTPTKVTVSLEANVANARVTFRRRVTAAPAQMQIAPSDIVELVEVSAPGHKTTRYWLTFDRPTKLVAQLAKGTGSLEATEEATLIALGEVKAPTKAVVETPKPAVAVVTPAPAPVAKTVAPAPQVAAVTQPKPMTGEPSYVPRKIGRAATDEMPPEAKEPVAEPKIEAMQPVEEPTLVEQPEQAEPVVAKPAPVAPDVKPAPPRSAIDTATVSAVVGQNRPAVMKCFSDGKKTNPKMKGSLQVHLAVDTAGKVKQVQVQSTLNAPLVASCVAKSVNSWKFPSRSTGQIAMVSYPFTIN
ncbi:MAG: protein kinase [Myxococcota bacterium]|nr:protein kinase [Myxococcota bacterium]